MIVLKRNNNPIAVIENPTWTCLQSNGYSVVCERSNANGVVANGLMYHIAGTVDNGYDTVTTTEVFDNVSIIESMKSAKINESKTLLEKYLEEHPLEYSGKNYSVTEEKQALITGNIAAYQLATTLGQTAELTWNATGEACVVWTFENLAALAVAIKAYVKPLVAYQQAYEVSVNACTTEEAINAIPLDYSSVVTNA